MKNEGQMKTSTIILLTAGIGLGIFLIVSGIFFVIQMINPPAVQGDNNYNNTITPHVTNDTGPLPDSPGKLHDVEIKNFAFNPSTLTIKAGETVVWTNMDSVEHGIVSDSGNELGSGVFKNGETYSHTFYVLGTYDYHCSVHTSMKGKIIVE